jgi:hypothetical protein
MKSLLKEGNYRKFKPIAECVSVASQQLKMNGGTVFRVGYALDFDPIGVHHHLVVLVQSGNCQFTSLPAQ